MIDLDTILLHGLEDVSVSIGKVFRGKTFPSLWCWIPEDCSGFFQNEKLTNARSIDYFMIGAFQIGIYTPNQVLLFSRSVHTLLPISSIVLALYVLLVDSENFESLAGGLIVAKVNYSLSFCWQENEKSVRQLLVTACGFWNAPVQSFLRNISLSLRRIRLTIYDTDASRRYFSTSKLIVLWTI